MATFTIDLTTGKAHLFTFDAGGGSPTITGATNGLTINNLNVGLGGTINTPTTLIIASGLTFTDSRIGANQTGIIYGGDYAVNYVNRSLVDKAYVDAIASGLQIHAAAMVATTGNTSLSGLTIIDGVQTTVDMRILVKNQVDGTKNGIYDAKAGLWIRSSDYNFIPSGEITSGDLIPVTSGNTNYNTLWSLVTPDPIVSGTSLTFTLFSNVQNTITAINNVGTGTTLSSTLGTIASIKSISTKGGISLLGDGNNLILSGGTNVSNLGTGTTLASKSDVGATVSVKSISVRGGIAILGDTNNIILSGGSSSAGIVMGRTLTGATSLAIGDANKYLRYNSVSDNNITVPKNTFTEGTSIFIEQYNTGALTFVAQDGNIVVNGNKKSAGRYYGINLVITDATNNANISTVFGGI